MSDDLKTLEQWASVLLVQMNPANRRKVSAQVAQDLRRSQQQRIKAQMTPEGLQYTPRKPRKDLSNKKDRIKKAEDCHVRQAAHQCQFESESRWQ
ncbi:phage virion morphogenesis protein [Undibacterium sp. Di27W]|uniref:phage virion morphogenesis protein n=1 Tax=Undibacterium sp. Di27W TaxID=3413036 RepID=UPI003BF380C1